MTSYAYGAAPSTTPASTPFTSSTPAPKPTPTPTPTATMPTTQNITTTTDLPDFIKPSYENLIGRAETLSYDKYIPYGYTQDSKGNVIPAIDPITGKPVDASRIADFNEGQVKAQQDAYNLAQPTQFADATTLAKAVGTAATTPPPGSFEPSAYTFADITAPTTSDYSMDAASTFDDAAAKKYMSPYMQNVLDAQKREALTDAKKTQLMTNLGASRQGTYGGSRQLLAGTERERALGMQLGDIQAKGLQAAYENAQSQFERDRTAGYNVNKANLDSSLTTQDLKTKTGLDALRANLDAAVKGSQLSEQSKQFGGTMDMDRLSKMLTSAQTLNTLGTAQQDSDLQRIGAQASAGAEQQGMDQRYLDLREGDFLRQRDYDKNQLNYLSDILRGVPVTSNSTATSSAPKPSVASQIGGGALSLLSLYNLASGRK